ncbi:MULTISPECIES: hypothetical protein [unclassified Pseudomonas]|uniref:hypothetical protein n=1 Tax=Pseudomonas sp. Irchel s3a12 TaxID=2009047 RepID=UPI000BA42C60|nr:hypothetical protein [Pseudomonas sp. Irchel s3a12]
MIPNYRIRIYCCIGALFCLIVTLACAEQLHNAGTLGQFDVTTGRGVSKVREHLVFDQQPWRFGFYLLMTIAVFIASTGAGLWLCWGVLRGRRAFKRWSGKFR